MTDNFTFYVFCLVAIVVGFLVVKKIASCLIKSVIMLAIAAVLVYVYFSFFMK